mmetsp:Transcript_29634/g.76568  ORF Transcript_29634/g.76568 Transcript_29634/m.76568 type:complete len:315 (-) Transcript_29634:142-1086(-)
MQSFLSNHRGLFTAEGTRHSKGICVSMKMLMKDCQPYPLFPFTTTRPLCFVSNIPVPPASEGVSLWLVDILKLTVGKDHCRESITICPDTFVSQAAVKTTDRTVFEDYAQFFLKRGIDPTSVPSFTPKKRRSLSEYGVESDANRDGFETPSSLSKKRRVDEGTVVEPISGPLEYYCLELLRYEGFAINTFESPVFREFVRALNPDISLPSRSRLKALLHADYKRPTSRSSMPAPETPSSAVKATSVTTVDPVSSNTGAPSGIPLSAPLDVAQTAESVYSSVALPVTSSSLPTAELVVAPNVSTSSSLPLVPSSS